MFLEEFGKWGRHKIFLTAVITLEDSSDERQPVFENAVGQSFDEVCRFIDDPRNKHYLRLNDDAISRIKEELFVYTEVATRNYQAFKERVEEESHRVGR